MSKTRKKQAKRSQQAAQKAQAQARQRAREQAARERKKARRQAQAEQTRKVQRPRIRHSVLWGVTPVIGLAMLGWHLQAQNFFAPLFTHLRIAQKKVVHEPVDKLLDAFIAMLDGARRVEQLNTTLRADPRMQAAWGRESCAEQSTVQETLNACTTENVQELRQALKEIYRAHGLAPRHHFGDSLLFLTVDLSPLPGTKQDEGAEKGHAPRQRSRRCRQVVRVIADPYGEIVCELLKPGKTASRDCLKEAIQMAADVLELTPEQKARTVVCFDAGFGTMENLNWLLHHGYQVLGKAYNHKPVAKLVQTVPAWQRRGPNQWYGAVGQPHRYGRRTRQIAVRTKAWNETKRCHEENLAVLITTLEGETDGEILTLYRRRTQIETSLRESKQALGLAARRKHSLVAQEVLVLLAQLAYNLLRWAKDWLAPPSPKLAGLGLLRLLRDGLKIQGRISAQEEGLTFTIDTNHPYAEPLRRAFAELFPDDKVHVRLGEI